MKPSFKDCIKNNWSYELLSRHCNWVIRYGCALYFECLLIEVGSVVEEGKEEGGCYYIYDLW